MSNIIKPTTVPSKRLAASINALSSSLQLNDILSWDGVTNLASTDFGDLLYAVLRNDSNTAMELIQLDPSTIANSSITILRRGLKFTGDLTTEVTANKLTWVKNETIVELGSDVPQLFQWLKEYIDAAAVAGAVDASSTAKGIVEMATAAEITADTAVGATSAKLAVGPDQLALSKYGLYLPSSGQKDALAGGGTFGTPSTSNKYLTETYFSANTNTNIFDQFDQTQTTQDSQTAVGEANATTKKNKLAQSFTSGHINVRGVELYKSADTGSFTGTVTVALQADSAGAPSGSNLASVTIANATWLLMPTGTFQAQFSAEYATTTGSVYWIVISTSTSDNSNHPNIGHNSAGGYVSGSSKYNNTTDGWVANGTLDLYFKVIEGTISQIPKTGSDGLIPLAVSHGGIVAVDTTSSALATSNTETTVFTKVLPAGFFTANSGLRVNISSTYDYRAATTSTHTVRIKLNGTTVGTISDLNEGQWVNQATAIHEFIVVNANSLSSQVILMKSLILNILTTGLLNTTTNIGTSTAQAAVMGLTAANAVANTSSVATAGPVVLTITMQNGESNSGTGYNYKWTLVEKIA